ncbi:meiotic recombination protein SPO11 [Trichonephila clavipes]|nr:meiotic recombination protein SPO11 [Trichonephila clavipes]
MSSSTRLPGMFRLPKSSYNRRVIVTFMNLRTCAGLYSTLFLIVAPPRRAMSFDVEKLAVPEIRWLGLLPSDIEKLQIPKAATTPITEHDVKKIENLLQRPYVQNNIQWKHQIAMLLEKKQKSEIEGLSKIKDDFLPKIYLPNKIRYGGWI